MFVHFEFVSISIELFEVVKTRKKMELENNGTLVQNKGFKEQDFVKTVDSIRTPFWENLDYRNP